MVHAAVNSKFDAFKKHVNDIAASNKNVKTFFIYEKPTDEDKESKSYDKEGYITLDFLQKVLPSKQADFYFCGVQSLL